MMNDKIISITFPKCGTCQYGQVFDGKSVDCFGMPPSVQIIGTSQDPLGRPNFHIEIFSPRVPVTRVACSLYKARQDFATAGQS